MKFIVAVISILVFQASASFLDDIRGIFKPIEFNVHKLVTDVVSGVHETIDCTIMAVENVFSFGGMFAVNPEYERRCKGVTKDNILIPTIQDTNSNTTKEINKLDARQKIQINIERNDAQGSIIKNKTERLVVISKMIRQELGNLSTETKKKFNILDIDLEHVSVQQVLGEIGALYKLEQSDRSSSRANEIRHLFHKILGILHVHDTGGRHSDGEDVKEIFKNLEKTENNLIDIKKKLSPQKDLQKNTVHNKNVNKLQKEIDNIPKTFKDIAKKIRSQGSINDIRRSNASEILISHDKTAAKIQNMDVKRNFPNTTNQITKESKSVDDIFKDSEKENKNVKVTMASENSANQTLKDSKIVDTTNAQEQTLASKNIQGSANNTLEDSKKKKDNVDVASDFQSIANRIMEESKPVNTDQVKSIEKATNILSQSTNQQEKYYVSNSVRSRDDDIFKDSEKECQIVDGTKSFQKTTSDIMEDSKTGDTTKERDQTRVSYSNQESVNNTFEDTKKPKQNLDLANYIQSIATQIMGESKPVDTDQIVKSIIEAANIFNQSTYKQEKNNVPNSVSTRVDEIFKGSEIEYQNVDVDVSEIIQIPKTVETTKEQEQSFVSNSTQETVNNLFEDSKQQKKKLGVLNTFQSITNQIREESKPVYAVQIVKSTEEATNVYSQDTSNQQEENNVSNSVGTRVDDIDKDSKKEYKNVKVSISSQDTANQILKESKIVDTIKEQEQTFVSNSIQESVNNTFEDSKKIKENIDIASTFQSISNQVMEVSKPVGIDQVMKSTEGATNFISQSSNQQGQYYDSNSVQARGDNIFKDSGKECQNVDTAKRFEYPARQVTEESKPVDTTKEREQTCVSNSTQESVNNTFEDRKKPKQNVDLANYFKSIANQIMEGSKLMDTDQIVKSIKEAADTFKQITYKQEKYNVSNSVRIPIDGIFKDSEKEIKNVDVAKNLQNTASQIIEESKTVDTSKDQEQSSVPSNIQESLHNTFNDSKNETENVDVANTFQSIRNQIMEESKPMDTDQIVKSTEGSTNLLSHQKDKYYDSNSLQAHNDNVFKEKECQTVDGTRHFENTTRQIMGESKTVDTTKEQQQASVSHSIQEGVNNTYKDSKKEKENVDKANRFQSIADQVKEESKPVYTDQIVKATEESTDILSQSSNQRSKYYDSNSVQTRVDDIFKDSENEYLNVDVTKTLQNTANLLMEESKTRITKEKEQVLVSSVTQESVNNTFKDSKEQKENVDKSNGFQSTAYQLTEASKPVETDQIVKATEEATNSFSQPSNQQSKYYDSNSFQAHVDNTFKDPENQNQNVDVTKTLQNTANLLMEESKTTYTTKKQEQYFHSNSIKESFNNTFEDSKIEKENIDEANSFQSIVDQFKEESKPVYTDQTVKATEPATNLFSQSSNQQGKYYDSNNVHARVDNIFKDSEKEYQYDEVTKSVQTVDTTRNQGQAFVSNSVQENVNEMLESSKKQNENVKIATSFQSVANQITEGSKPLHSHQVVKSTEEATFISESLKDQEINSYSSQYGLNNVFKESKSGAPKPSVSVLGPNDIGVNAPISQNIIPITPIIPSPAITSVNIATADAPEYYDYDTDENSLFSQLFGSYSEEDQAIYKKLFGTSAQTDNKENNAAMEAENIIEQSRFTMDHIFNKANSKDAVNVFDNPELLNYGKK